MASLRKFKASRFWFAVYRDAAGNQCNRSTKIKIAGEGKTNRERARDAAEKRRLAEQIAKIYEDTHRGHPTEQHVQKVLLDIFAKVNKRRIEPAITETFFRTWLGRVRTEHDKNAETEGATARRYRRVIERFMDSLGPRRSVQLVDLTTADVQAFIDAAKASGKAPATVRIEQKILNAAFADAKRSGFLAHNPAAMVAVPIDAGESRKPFEWAQVRAILQACAGDWKTAVMLGVFTGARLGDCVSMRWRNVELPARTIHFRPSKTRAKRSAEIVVPLHPDLEAYLMTLELPDGPDGSEQPLCPTLARVKIGGRRGLSRKFQEILANAGIENEVARTGSGEGRTFFRYGFHSLRHTFNTVLLNSGVSQELRMKLSGHASEQVNDRYSHAEIETLRAAVAKLPTVAP